MALIFESLFEKRTYNVDIFALKWELDTKKFEKRIVRYIKRGRKGVLDWYEVEQHPDKMIKEIIGSDISILNRWMHRSLIRKGYLKVNYPETVYQPSLEDRVWLVEGTYIFKFQVIKRDEHLDKRFDKNTTLYLPKGQYVFELAIVKEEPTVIWTKDVTQK